MKPLITTLSLCIIVVFAHASQQPTNIAPGKRASIQVQELQTKLMLTDKQKTAMYGALYEQYSKTDSLKKINADHETIKNQFKLGYQKITSVLNTDQIKVYNQWLLAHKK